MIILSFTSGFKYVISLMLAILGIVPLEPSPNQSKKDKTLEVLIDSTFVMDSWPVVNDSLFILPDQDYHIFYITDTDLGQ
ncbi:MAG: hypothetical protein K9G76_11890 [Bacteroidales bacterium]|nr:hypothetical protein [Bacteroidales bacterium]MCF8405144.1 hypothetical protein [Bacteroidales bacterium]